MRHPADHPAIEVPWDEVVADLSDRGWSLVQHALNSRRIEQLAAENGSRWRRLEDQGVARQHGFGTYLPFDSTRPSVLQVGRELNLGLSEAAERRCLPRFPAFNEVTWTRYPAQKGRVTKHRDFRVFAGIIAVFTLRGSSTFRVFNSEVNAVEWQTMPGQLALLRGEGWPSEGERCPPHEVDPPSGGERSIMTLRCNSMGAGAGYDM